MSPSMPELIQGLGMSWNGGPLSEFSPKWSSRVSGLND